LLGRWLVRIDIGCVDEVPFLAMVEVVNFGRPTVEGIGRVLWGFEDEFDFGRVPVSQYTATEKCDIVIG